MNRLVPCIFPTLVVFLAASTAPLHADLITTQVSAQSDPYLAGMPAGTGASVVDSAPAQSPVLVTGLPLFAGEHLMFQTSGWAANGPRADQVNGPDGGAFTRHLTGPENGLSDYRVPISSLVGVFLGDTPPNQDLAPSLLDFRPGGNVTGGVDYLTLSPQLKQVFFIGDGVTDGGVQQQILVPSGATRLFLGVADGYEWSNNPGEYNVSIFSLNATSVAPEPGALTLAGLGALVLSGYRRFRR